MFIDVKNVKPSRETEFANALCELGKDWKQQADSEPKPRRRRFKPAVLFLIGGLLVYALSMGPVGGVVKSLPRRSPGFRFATDVYQTVYGPMFLLRDYTPLAAPIDLYLSFWGAK
jgi:hypothetical protein